MPLANLWRCLAALAATTLAAPAITVTATLDSDQAAVGQPSQLTVTVTGSQEQPSIGNVDGLDITAVGQSMQIETVNGSMTSSVSTTYTVTPERNGTFVIPAIHVGDAASQPITFRVAAAAAATAPPTANGGALPPPPMPSTSDTSGVTAQPPYGFIRVVLPKKECYVGELVPIDIEAFVPESVQITQVPQLASDAFTMNALSLHPDRGVQADDGRTYMVFTWHTALTAVKPGSFPLSLRVAASVIVPSQLPRMDPDDPFGAFRNMMSSMGGTRKEVTLENSAESVAVLPLPPANRPADFAGAVGQFQVESSASPTQASAGDPITLRLKISGTGNFDRVASEMLTSDPHWKTYPPKSSFEPADSVGFQGAKTFEQPIIANDATVTSVPPVSFSFFDPEKREYVTRSTAPIAVTITGSVAAVSAPPGPLPAPTPAADANDNAAPAPSTTAVTDLRPNAIEPGVSTATLRPLFADPWFLGAQALPLLALLVGVGVQHRRQTRLEPQRLRSAVLQRAVRDEVEAMDRAMAEHKTGAFFVHARNALRQRFGDAWNLRPESITIADIEARGAGDAGSIRTIFDLADQASYSDLQLGEADLRDWRKVVLDELGEKSK